MRAPLACILADRRGSSAVEFALVCVPFLILVLGIVELGFMLLVSVLLDGAVADTAKAMQETNDVGVLSAADVRTTLLCPRLLGLVACDAGLILDVAPTDTVVGGGTRGAVVERFDLGAEREVIAVRAYKAWRPFTPLLRPLLTTGGGGVFDLLADAYFVRRISI